MGMKIQRATLPPTWLFGHHHPGSRVGLPALAHHTFGQRRWGKEKKIPSSAKFLKLM